MVFVDLGDFPREGRLPLAEDGVEFFQQTGGANGRLEKDQEPGAAAARSRKFRRFAPRRAGGKPKKLNTSVGSPATESAAGIADGPGIARTGRFARRAARTMR